MKKYLVVAFLLVVVVAVGTAEAQKAPAAGIFQAAPGNPEGGTTQDGVPDSMVSMNMGGAESWDLVGSPNNQVLTEAMGAGAIVTGANWNVTITTVGASWLSEAQAHMGSSSSPSVVIATPGAADAMPGSMTYVGGGDFTDNAVPNITLDADGMFVMELAESFDDVTDAVDANYDAGTYDMLYIAGAPVPTMPTLGLIALVISLLALGMVLLRRRARVS